MVALVCGSFNLSWLAFPSNPICLASPLREPISLLIPKMNGKRKKKNALIAGGPSWASRVQGLIGDGRLILHHACMSVCCRRNFLQPARQLSARPSPANRSFPASKRMLPEPRAAIPRTDVLDARHTSQFNGALPLCLSASQVVDLINGSCHRPLAMQHRSSPKLLLIAIGCVSKEIQEPRQPGMRLSKRSNRGCR